MRKFNRKGLSEVVTAILVILLVLVAITVVWMVVSNFMKQGGTGATNLADCALIQMDITSARNVTSATPATDKYVVTLNRPATGSTGPETVTSVSLAFSDGTNTRVATKPVALKETNTQSVDVLYSELTGTGGIAAGAATSVSVAPVLANGNICDTKDTRTIMKV